MRASIAVREGKAGRVPSAFAAVCEPQKALTAPLGDLFSSQAAAGDITLTAEVRYWSSLGA